MTRVCNWCSATDKAIARAARKNKAVKASFDTKSAEETLNYYRDEREKRMRTDFRAKRDFTSLAVKQAEVEIVGSRTAAIDTWGNFDDLGRPGDHPQEGP